MANQSSCIEPETSESRDVIVITGDDDDSTTYIVNRNNVIEILDEPCSNTNDSAQDDSVIEIDDSFDDDDHTDGVRQREISRSNVSEGSASNTKQSNQAMTGSTQKQIMPANPCTPGYKCAICLESLLQEQALSMPPCGHVFCAECITAMCRESDQRTCPKCRRRFQTRHLKTVFF